MTPTKRTDNFLGADDASVHGEKIKKKYQNDGRLFISDMVCPIQFNAWVCS
jgi:hypothetical protein